MLFLFPNFSHLCTSRSFCFKFLPPKPCLTCPMFVRRHLMCDACPPFARRLPDVTWRAFRLPDVCPTLAGFAKIARDWDACFSDFEAPIAKLEVLFWHALHLQKSFSQILSSARNFDKQGFLQNHFGIVTMPSKAYPLRRNFYQNNSVKIILCKCPGAITGFLCRDPENNSPNIFSCKSPCPVRAPPVSVPEPQRLRRKGALTGCQK